MKADIESCALERSNEPPGSKRRSAGKECDTPASRSSGHGGGVSRALVLLSVIIVAAVAAYAAWRWTPLAEWVDIAAVHGWLKSVREQPLSPYILMGAYVAASQIMFPITVLIIATAYAFGPWFGFAYAMVGSLLGALVTYGIGYSLGPETFKRLAGRYCNTVNRALTEQGLPAAIMTHMLPVAPFTLVNLGSGVARIRFRDFLLGTLLGMAPGTALTTIFIHRIEEMFRNPGIPSLALLAASAALVYFSWRWGRRRMSR